MDKSCERCGDVFHCGAQQGQGPCWCLSLPPARFIPVEFADCLCPSCLKAFIEEPQAQASPDLQEGEDFYYDENRNFVFTSRYHLKRGSCCKNNCRHCPY